MKLGLQFDDGGRENASTFVDFARPAAARCAGDDATGRSTGVRMYYAVILLTMVVAPLVSIAIEFGSITGLGGFVLAATKWFAFWAVGVRLLLAGASQILRPGYTLDGILGVDEPRAHVVVQELGFANAAIGLAGLLSIIFSIWALPVAFIGGLFLALAGFNHLQRPHRNLRETVAMVSDLWAAAILLAVFVFSLF